MKPDAAARDIETTAARWVARRDAGLSPADEAEFQRWLNAAPSHRAAVAFYDATWSTLARPAQHGAAASLEMQLEKLSARRRRRRMAVAASIAFVLLASGVVRWQFSTPATAVTAGSAVVHVPSRQALPDGSIVELKGDSRIAVDYTTTARRVTLVQGEAHFAVEKDPARPFVVSASGVDVRAVGTAFSVQKGTTAIEVLVTHGKVAVERPALTSNAHHAEPEPVAALEAGNLLVVPLADSNVAPASRAVARPELEQRLGWRSPRLEFTRTPLGEAVDLINQHALPDAPRLAISDPRVATLRISGVFRADNVEAFVVLLEGVFDVKADRTDSTILLRQSR